MNDQRRPLENIQRWMQSVITHPLGIEQGIVSDDARREIATSIDDIESVVTRSHALTSIERLAVYGNAYFARLLECMRELFPATLQAVGEEAFDGFALEYLQRYPPHRYTLDHLADDFVVFLEATRPDDEDVSWADFVIDLARLEWTIDKVFDGPGIESRPLLTAEQLQSVPPTQWPQATLTPAPCLRLVRFRFPVNSYYSEFRQQREPDLPEPRETFAAISRRAYVVRRFDLSESQFDLLRALVAGESLEAALAAAARGFFAGGGSEEQLAKSLQNWFQAWTVEGFFTSVVIS